MANIINFTLKLFHAFIASVHVKSFVCCCLTDMRGIYIVGIHSIPTFPWKVKDTNVQCEENLNGDAVCG